MTFTPADFWPPGPPTAGPATDQVARDAAAAAQGTANAAVSTGAELDALLRGDPAAAAAFDHRSPLSLKDSRCGAKGDGIKLAAAGAMASGSAVLTAAGAAFVAADVGKSIAVKGAVTGGLWGLVTTILSWQSATQVTLAANCTSAVTTADVYYATNDTPAFLAARALLAATGGVIDVPPVAGFYWLGSLSIGANWSRITARGRGKPRIFSASNALGMFCYASYPTQEFQLAGAALTGVARRGTYAVTLVSAGDAAKPAVGATVAIMTSNTASLSAVALGEFNVVQAISGATITLKYPLVHAYRPGVVATPAYQIVAIDVPDRFVLEGLILEQWTGIPYEVHGINCALRNIETESIACPAGRGRHWDVDYIARIKVDWFAAGPPAHGRRPYAYVFDTMTSHVRAKVVTVSDGMGIIHVHENQCHIDLDADVTCGEVDAGATEPQWGVGSISGGCHDMRLRLRVRNAPLSYGYVNVGGITDHSPAPYAMELSAHCSGVATTQAFRTTVADGFPGLPLPLRYLPDNIEQANLFTDTYAAFADEGSLRVLPLPLSAWTAVAPSAQTTFQGEPVISFPESSNGVAIWQADLKQSMLTRSYVWLVGEFVSGGGDTVLGLRMDTLAKQGPTGVAFTGNLTQIPAFGAQNKNPKPGATGSFFYVSGVFAVDTANAATNKRFGFEFTRIVAAGTDTSAADMYLRKAYAVFYNPHNA